MTLQISAPTRLHFGLLHVPVPGSQRPAFGGLGAMLDEPRVDVRRETALAWSFSGTLAERAKQFVDHIVPKLESIMPMQVEANGPAEHIGLGVGTALGMAIAKMLTLDQPGADLAALAGRGERSRIGVRGFKDGGFHFDAGHGMEQESRRFNFPENWRFALIKAPGQNHWYGDRERTAFSRKRSLEDAARTTGLLLEIVRNRLIPALSARYFSRFASALGDFNRAAGEHFAVDQGGLYASLEIAEVIGLLRENGFEGVGQSSWGPTLFVLVESPEDIERIRKLVTIETVSTVAANGASTGLRLPFIT